MCVCLRALFLGKKSVLTLAIARALLRNLYETGSNCGRLMFSLSGLHFSGVTTSNTYGGIEDYLIANLITLEVVA